MQGFARFFEQKGKDAYDPGFRSEERALLTCLHASMDFDAVPAATVPVRNPIDNPRYDPVLSPTLITYEKAASVVRMLEFVLGEDTMREGLRDYLGAHAYGNVEQGDLWEALAGAALADGVIDQDFDLAAAMDAWTAESGFPVVSVAQDSDSSVQLSQSKFYLYPADNPGNDTTIWSIPVTVSYPSSSSDYQLQWMTADTMSMDVSETPYVLNFQERGYYRVNYDYNNWIAIAENLNHNLDDIDPSSRAQIYDDSLNLARAGLLSYEITLQVVQSLVFEKEYIPLRAGINGLSYIGQMLRANPTIYSEFQQFMVDLLLPNYETLTFDQDPSDDFYTVLARDTVIREICSYGHEDCIARANALFSAWMSTDNPDQTNPINPNLRETVYQAAARSAGREEYEFLLDRLAAAGEYGFSEEVQYLLWALGKISDEDILNELLDLTIAEDSPIRSRDAGLVYSTVGSTVEGRNLQFLWLVENYRRIQLYFGSSFGGKVGSMLGVFAEQSNFPSDISELEAFLDHRGADLGGTLEDLQLALEKARRNKEWVEANFADVLLWLDERYGTDLDPAEVAPAESPDLDLPLAAERPDRAVAGQQASISCVFGGENVLLESACSWVDPQGVSLDADLSTGQVTEAEAGEVVDGLTAFGDDKTCGLTILSVEEESDLGEWTCLLNEGQQGVPFHEGTFSLLAEGHVSEDMRLPRYLMLTVGLL